jgi:DNA-directed RNA polymerase subunit RPC12/RpoP
MPILAFRLSDSQTRIFPTKIDETKPLLGYPNNSRNCIEPMEIRKCSNGGCGKYFQFNAFDIPLRSNDEPREVECPHCGHYTGEQSRATFIVHGLAPEQEALLMPVFNREQRR